jgi:hypothetical protein
MLKQTLSILPDFRLSMRAENAARILRLNELRGLRQHIPAARLGYSPWAQDGDNRLLGLKEFSVGCGA